MSFAKSQRQLEQTIKHTEEPAPTAEPIRCSYCKNEIGSDDYLKCLVCCACVHVQCLRHASTPGDLLGDVFFDFTCAECMQLQYDGPSTSSSAVKNAREKFVRQRLPWMIVITLALYNLSIKSEGLSHHGYFHWRTHIVNFIDRNWGYLFGSYTRKRKQWIGSVSGNLSHHSPEFFLSGQEAINENGWWKLTHSQKPKYIYKLYEQHVQKRQEQRIEKRLREGQKVSVLPSSSCESKRLRMNNPEDDIINGETCSRAIPYMGRQPKMIIKHRSVIEEDSKNLPHSQQQPEPMNTVQAHLMDFLAETLSNDDLTMFNSFSNIAPEPLVGGGKNDFLIESQNENANFFEIPDVDMNCCQMTSQPATQPGIGDKLTNYCIHTNQTRISGKEAAAANDDELSEEICTDSDEDEEFRPKIVQVTNFQQLDTTNDSISSQCKISVDRIKKEVLSEAEQSGCEDAHMQVQQQTDDEEDSAETGVLDACKESLFTKQPRRKWPWLVQKNTEEDEFEDTTHSESPDNGGKTINLTMMSEYEEKELLQRLRKIFSLEEQCQLQIPAYIRRFYRKLCVREWKREHSRPLFNLDNFLDTKNRSRHSECIKPQIIDRYQLISLADYSAKKSFHARIAGSFEYELFESPYTRRVLHPFIYRNKQCFPPFLKLLCEVQYTVTGEVPSRAPIDFCYVRPNHIAAVNALLQSLFWPGIDMTECLSYPDFSVVALYKKLVVGCAFLVPDVGFNEAYISFMAVRPGWQRSGIATFMLYHLIQTCTSKDITLHVSATNPAVVLYQKFGFKIEEVILGFYEKYLPIDSKHSRHAFFLRLLR